MTDHAKISTSKSSRYNGSDENYATLSDGSSIGQRQRETAQYISDMILELRNLAKSVQLYTVMVPLEYSYYEAFAVANKVDAPPDEVERIRELTRQGQLAAGGPIDY